MMSSYIVHWSRRCKPGLLDRLISIRILIPVRRHHDTKAALWLHSISLFLAPSGYTVYFQYSQYTANIHRRQSGGVGGWVRRGGGGLYTANIHRRQSGGGGGGNRASLRLPLSDTQFPYIAWTIGCTEEKRAVVLVPDIVHDEHNHSSKYINCNSQRKPTLTLLWVNLHYIMILNA